VEVERKKRTNAAAFGAFFRSRSAIDGCRSRTYSELPIVGRAFIIIAFALVQNQG